MPEPGCEVTFSETTKKYWCDAIVYEDGSYSWYMHEAFSVPNTEELLDENEVLL
jgi:hypothetical protein